jgi:hypothetical protein
MVVALFDWRGEAVGADAIWRLYGGNKGIVVVVVVDEEAKERGLAVVCAEAAEEAGVFDEAEPALADERGTEEGGGLRGEAEEDLPEEVVIIRRGYRRRRCAAAAPARRTHGFRDLGLWGLGAWSETASS